MSVSRPQLARLRPNDAPLIGERAPTEGGDEHAEEPYSTPRSASSRLAFACAFLTSCTVLGERNGSREYEALLKKVAAADTTKPAELVSIAKLQHVLSVLPRVTSGVEVSVSVSCPRRKYGDIETMHWWEVAVEDHQLGISSGGHFYRRSTGGDSFTTMSWTAIPAEPSALDDYRESLWMVPDVGSFPQGIASIDFASGGCAVEVTDDENPLLEEDTETADEDADDETDEEPEDKDDGEIEADEEMPRPWSITPIDTVEERLASTVDPDQIDANEPQHAYSVNNCDFCGCDLGRRGLFVDARLRGDLMWGNMCAACFASRGEGVGWGNGQLYARQPDGKWRMVAGWGSSDPVA